MMTGKMFKGMFGNMFANPRPGDDDTTTTFPPVQDKLITWLDGSITDATHKTDLVNDYDFLISSPETTTWDGEYQAPASGQPGHTELLAIDDGTFFTDSTPNTLDYATLMALVSDQFIFCEAQGLVIYDEVLTGDELFYALAHCEKAEAVTQNGIVVTYGGEIVYVRS